MRIHFYKEKKLKKIKINGFNLKISEDWRIVELRDIVKNEKFSIVDGPFGSQLHSSEYVTEGIPLIRVNNINRNGNFNPADLVYIGEEKFEELKRSAVYSGDIILAKTGATIGKVCIFPNKFEKGLIASSCAKISIDFSKADNRYTFYFLLSDFGYNQILALATGATRPTINLMPISKIKIFLPKSLNEQQKIAHILMSIDKAIEAIDESIKIAERIKRGLMQELLTKGIGHKEFKDTKIGRIPKNWKVVKLKDLFNVETGTTPSTKKEEYWNNGTIYWITPIDLSKLNGEICISDSGRKITKKALEDCNLTLLPRGSIIISTRAPVGYVAVLDVDATFNQGCKGLIPKSFETTNVKFYCYYLLSVKKRLEQLSGGSTFKELSKNALENLQIPLPPLSEQCKIAEILSKWDKIIELKKAKKDKLEKMKKKVMELLLTGKVRVR